MPRSCVVERNEKRLRRGQFLRQEGQVRCVDVRRYDDDRSLHNTTANHHTEIADVRTEPAWFGELLDLKLCFRVWQVDPFLVRVQVARHFLRE